MGIFSWFGSRKRAGRPGRHRATSDTSADIPDQPPSLVRTHDENPGSEEVEPAAAEDVAKVREDDKYFSSDSPANKEDEL